VDVLILDELTMLVTGDPVAELDSALCCATQRLRQARVNGDDAAAARQVAWARPSARRAAVFV
jgi:hypothetical protein